MGQAVKGVGGVGGPVPCLSPQPRLPPICKPAAPLEGGGDAWKGTGLVKANEGMQRRPAEEPALGDRTNKRLPLPSSWSSGRSCPSPGSARPEAFPSRLLFLILVLFFSFLKAGPYCLGIFLTWAVQATDLSGGPHLLVSDEF